MNSSLDIAKQVAADLPLKANIIPEAVSFFPQTFGWWFLFSLFVLLLLLVTWRLYLWRQHPVTHAQKILKQIIAEQELKPVQRVQAYNSLVRRLAVQLYTRQQVAALSGKDWQHFLCDTSVSVPTGEQEVAALIAASYQADTKFDEEKIVGWLQGWLKQQRHQIRAKAKEESYNA